MLDHFYPMPQEPPKAEWLEAIRKKNGSEVVVPLGIA